MTKPYDIKECYGKELPKPIKTEERVVAFLLFVFVFTVFAYVLLTIEMPIDAGFFTCIGISFIATSGIFLILAIPFVFVTAVLVYPLSALLEWHLTTRATHQR